MEDRAIETRGPGECVRTRFAAQVKSSERLLELVEIALRFAGRQLPGDRPTPGERLFGSERGSTHRLATLCLGRRLHERLQRYRLIGNLIDQGRRSSTGSFWPVSSQRTSVIGITPAP